MTADASSDRLAPDRPAPGEAPPDEAVPDEAAPDRLADVIAAGVRDVPDFPRTGVVFADLAPLLADVAARRVVVDGLADRARRHVQDEGVRHVVALDARGFVLGSLLAERLGLGLVLARKGGKLPGPVLSESFSLEYGEAELQTQADAVSPGDAVLLVDDVLATGGTLAAARALVERAGAHVAAAVVLLEVAGLGGREALGGEVVLHVGHTRGGEPS